MGPSRFRRLILPGLAFKAVVIGGGYATGRELVEFFLPAGPRGGLLGMALAMVVWSAVCILTFLFARASHSYDYRSFFKTLLGPGWVIYEICNLLFCILLLSVFGAAAGAIGEALFGWPTIVGTLLLIVGIGAFAALGNRAVEHLFTYVSLLLYGVYAVFFVLAFSHFGDGIVANFETHKGIDGWWIAGLNYTGYNVIGAILILPMIRHMTSQRDAVVAGALCGPFAILPAMIFFICMMAYYPGIGAEELPSNFLLDRLHFPAFQFLFQGMVFFALLECSTGAVHAINERVVRGLEAEDIAIPRGLRLIVSAALLILSIFVAERFGLIELIGNGYRILSWVFLAIYVLPLATYGVWFLRARKSRSAAEVAVQHP